MSDLRWVLVVFAVVGFWACGDAPEKNTDVLRQQFLDAKVSESERISVGRLLLRDDIDFVVVNYWKGHQALVQLLVDDLTHSQPDLAGRLLAALMAKAKGEGKLHFESQLVALGAPAVSALVDLSKEDVDWQTAMQILDALGKVKGTGGLDVMKRFLVHPNDWVRMAAAHALGDIGGEVVLGSLTTALEDTSETVVAAAVVALGKSGEPSAVRVCAPLLDHENPRLRGAAVSAIGRLGGDGARQLIVPMLKDKDAGVRYKSERALKELN